MKIITGSIHMTSNGAFPRKMQDVQATLHEIVDLMRVYNPQTPITEATDIIRRAAFTTDIVWLHDRSIGMKVESVVADRCTTHDLTDLAASIDLTVPTLGDYFIRGCGVGKTEFVGADA